MMRPSIVILFIILVTPSVPYCQEWTEFDEPFVIKTNFGTKIEIVKVAYDEDVGGDRLVLYETVDGQTLFIDFKSIMNWGELDNMIDGLTSDSSKGSSSDSTFVKDATYYVQSGMLVRHLQEIAGGDFYLKKRDGTISDRVNDVEELCRDYVFYRSKILEYSRKGKEKKADGYRRDFQQINAWLSEYHDDDVQAMFSYLNL